jgi:UDP-N-acetylmuramate--L-alanine ligase/UDP-N-acetylenolpyruvoylglucosamine reductase
MSDQKEDKSEAVAECLDSGAGHVHFVGICGIGMAGLAFLLKSRGFNVSGCDLSLNRISEWLEVKGIKVVKGHSPKHVERCIDLVVRTAAIPDDSAEIAHAWERGIPVFDRGEVLPKLLGGHTSIAVCGSHGKTTTTTFVTEILKSAGRDPSWCIGGENEALGGVAGAGKGEHMVVEADESDGTLALYEPDIAIVTNIEFDHMEHFGSVEAFEDCFRSVIKSARRKVVFCADDPRAAALCADAEKTLSYGFSEQVIVRGAELALTESSLCLAVLRDGVRLGVVELSVPGRHNALNALAATAACLELGLSFDEIVEGFKHVTLPRRRFERIAENDGILVVSDYAHHPSEIAALIRTAKQLKHSRLLAVFQPHRYTRTLALGAEFAAAFDGLDQLVLAPVYAAFEEPLKGGGIWDLYRRFRERKNETNALEMDAPETAVANSLEQAWAYYRHILRAGDVFLVIGAGDVEKIAGWAKEEMMTGAKTIADIKSALPPKDEFAEGTVFRFNEPLAGKTSLKVGGMADIFVEVASERDLVALLKWTKSHKLPFRALGAGSNVVVSDLGLRGMTARLTGADFNSIEEDDRGISVGAGVSLSRFLDWMEKHGQSGYEFLEGIPGTIGGALRMNAGAWGLEIGPKVISAKCVDLDGKISVLESGKGGTVPDMEFAYRSCRALENRILVRATLTKGSMASQEEIGKRRAELREKRNWWKGLRCAGSIFRNPGGDYAGRLIEQAGLKGARIGGAVVSAAHANVVVTEEGALASDVRCLIVRIVEEVFSKFKVKLETEVVFLE